MCIRDRPNTDTDVNPPPPENFQFRPGNNELSTTPNESKHPHRGITPMNYNADLYGKMTHPVEKILTEIPYTDGLNAVSYTHLIAYHQVPSRRRCSF